MKITKLTFTECSPCARGGTKHFTHVISSIFLTTYEGAIYIDADFTDVGIEVQGD